MAISREKAALLREEYLLKKENLLIGKVDGLSSVLFDKIFNKYLAGLEQTNGKIVYNKSNINLVQGLDEIFNKFNKSDNIPLIKSFINDLQAITPLNEVYFKTITQKPTAELSKNVVKAVNSSLGITKNGKIIHDGFSDKVIKDKSVISGIKKETLKAISKKQGFQQFKEGLKVYIEGQTGKPLSGKLQQYYRNYAYDTFHKVDRLNSQTFAAGLGLDFFYWAGGIINRSRAICIHANGKIVNANEFKQMSFGKLKLLYRDGITSGWIPMQDLGMWGCRHRVDFISNQMAMKHKDQWFDINSISNTHINHS